MTRRRPRIIIGCDGSQQSQEALDWAVDYARRTEGSLNIVSTWQWPTFQDVPITYGYRPDEGCRSRLQRLRGSADLPADRVETTVVRGHAAHVLMDLGKDADLIVVGSHGLGAISRIVLGSVSARVATQAECPVAIVRNAPAGESREGVLVGVDDSASARSALRWAMDYADLVHQPLRVVRAAEQPPQPISKGQADPFAYPTTELGRELSRWLDDLVDKEQAERGRDVEAGISTCVLEGSAPRAMVEQSETAGITVCGRRGSGGFQRLVIGSVASALAHHAHSTLVVTPAR